MSLIGLTHTVPSECLHASMHNLSWQNQNKHTQQKKRKQTTLKPCKSISTEVHGLQRRNTCILTSCTPLTRLQGGNTRCVHIQAAGSSLTPSLHCCSCVTGSPGESQLLPPEHQTASLNTSACSLCIKPLSTSLKDTEVILLFLISYFITRAQDRSVSQREVTFLPLQQSNDSDIPTDWGMGWAWKLKPSTRRFFKTKGLRHLHGHVSKTQK